MARRRHFTIRCGQFHVVSCSRVLRTHMHACVHTVFILFERKLCNALHVCLRLMMVSGEGGGVMG